MIQETTTLLNEQSTKFINEFPSFSKARKQAFVSQALEFSDKQTTRALLRMMELSKEEQRQLLKKAVADTKRKKTKARSAKKKATKTK